MFNKVMQDGLTNDYVCLLLEIIDEEIKMTSDYEEYDSFNTYRLTLRKNHIADDELIVVADELVKMGLLHFEGMKVEMDHSYVGFTIYAYSLTDYFKLNYKNIIDLYSL